MSGNGILIPAENGGFKGNIVTLQHGMRIELRRDPRHDGKSSDSPKFEIISPARSGEGVRVGVAWEKTSPKTGEIFLTLSLDDPSFAEPLYVAAFPREGGSYEISWRRRRGEAAAGSSRPLDDEIPF